MPWPLAALQGSPSAILARLWGCLRARLEVRGPGAWGAEMDWGFAGRGQISLMYQGFARFRVTMVC